MFFIFITFIFLNINYKNMHRNGNILVYTTHQYQQQWWWLLAVVLIMNRDGPATTWTRNAMWHVQSNAVGMESVSTIWNCGHRFSSHELRQTHCACLLLIRQDRIWSVCNVRNTMNDTGELYICCCWSSMVVWHRPCYSSVANPQTQVRNDQKT